MNSEQSKPKRKYNNKKNESNNNCAVGDPIECEHLSEIPVKKEDSIYKTRLYSRHCQYTKFIRK